MPACHATYKLDADLRAAHDALVDVIVAKYAPLPLATLGQLLSHLCVGVPQWRGEPYPLHAILPSNRFVPARVRALVDFLAQRFAGLPQAAPPAG